MNNKNWYKISAKDKILGRLATQVAMSLMGKDSPDYTPHEDKGSFFIITDAEKVRVTGNKENSKEYFFPSQYPGNSKVVDYKKMKEKKPCFIITHAVKGMLPKNKLGSRMLTRLKVYSGSEHPHSAQNPVDLEIQSD
ncbi:50S ribosomal protein L13 [Elusimicrobiota bacterium]